MNKNQLKKPKLSDFNLTENDIESYLKYEKECNSTAFNNTWFTLLIIAVILTINIGLLGTILCSIFIGPIALIVLYGFFHFITESQNSSLHDKGKRYQEYKDANLKYEQEYSRTLEIFWQKLNGYQFEQEVANLYKKLGYKVRRTGGSGDGGIDIILTDAVGLVTIVQCKAHKNPVGPAVIRDLYGTMINNKANRAILVSLSGCTSGVYSFARGKNISIITVNDLISMQKQFINK